MTTVKPPKQGSQSPVWKIFLLLIAVLGTAFVLYKQDPYTNALLAKDKKAAASQLRQNTGQGAKIPAASKQDPSEGRTFVIELAQLANNAKGEITIKTRPEWAPLGVAQFHKLMDEGFYKDTRFFRVVHNFVVQFGIHGEPGKFPKGPPIKDDPVKTTNARGTLTFATSGEWIRTNNCVDTCFSFAFAVNLILPRFDCSYRTQHENNTAFYQYQHKRQHVFR